MKRLFLIVLCLLLACKAVGDTPWSASDYILDVDIDFDDGNEIEYDLELKQELTLANVTVSIVRSTLLPVFSYEVDYDREDMEYEIELKIHNIDSYSSSEVIETCFSFEDPSHELTGTSSVCYMSSVGDVKDSADGGHAHSFGAIAAYSLGGVAMVCAAVFGFFYSRRMKAASEERTDLSASYSILA